jgi:hypothetical protein
MVNDLPYFSSFDEFTTTEHPFISPPPLELREFEDLVHRHLNAHNT